MLRLIAFIIVAPLLLVLIVTLFSFVVTYQRNSTNSGSVSSDGTTIPCTLNATTAIPASGKAETPVTFSATVTHTTCTEALTYEWSFGDEGTNSFIKENNQSHTYKTPGVYHWEVRINANGTTRYGQGGQIEIQPATQPRLIVALFSGFGNGPDDITGMTTLRDEIRADFSSRWGLDVFADAFTYRNQRSRGKNDDQCEELGWSELNRPHTCALKWISDLKPQPQDNIVLIGHSYGGNRARRMSYDIESLNRNLKVWYSPKTGQVIKV